MATTKYQGLPRAGFLRRIGAMLYDALIVISVAMLMGAIGLGGAYLALQQGWINLGDAPDLGSYLSQQPLFQVWIWGWIAVFYLYFWRKSGQTIGMRAWRLRVQNTDGSTLSYTQALIRLATAIVGLGNLQVLVSRQGMAFQDHWAHCEVVVLTKEQNRELISQQKL